MNDRIRAALSTIAFTLLAILTAMIVGGLLIIFSDPDKNWWELTANG